VTYKKEKKKQTSMCGRMATAKKYHISYSCPHSTYAFICITCLFHELFHIVHSWISKDSISSSHY